MNTTGAIAAGSAAGALIGVLAMGIFFQMTRDSNEKDPARIVAGAPEDAPAVTGSVAGAGQPGRASSPKADTTFPAQLRHEPAPSAEMQLRQLNENIAKHEAQWGADTEEPVAATQTEQRWQAAADARLVKEAASQPDYVATRCKASMCRIEGSFPANADSNEWATRLLLEMGAGFGASSILTLPPSNGRKNLVVYAYRLGREPPQ